MATVLLLVPAGLARGQGTWTLSLFVDPFPSPYQSDWETNANNSSLTIVNPTGADRDVVLVYQVTNTKGQILAAGRGDPLGIPPGAPTVLTSIVDIPGSSRTDQAMQSQIDRTGRLPEGFYTACVTMADRGGFVLGEDCDTFTIVYPDAPFLVAPGSGESITLASPLFQWTPIQVPAAYQVRYALQVAEMRQNQTPEEALNASIVHYQAVDLEVTNLQYPIEGQPFEVGKRYAWRVVATDQNGFPPSSNNGSSEIRSFLFDDGANAGVRGDIKLTLANDLDYGSASVPRPTPQDVDISELCARWDNPPTSVAISLASPLGLKRFAGLPSVLYRDSAEKKWWIAMKGRFERRSVLIGGDCGGLGGKTRTRWIASRDSALQARVGAMIASRPQGVATPVGVVDSLAFGMVVLALGREKIDVPADFAEGQAFLGEREIDLEVKRGLNVYMVLSLKDWGLWWLAQAIGFGEKEVALTGFLGWDAEWNLAGAVGEDAGVDISTEREFLVLRADFAERKPVIPFFRDRIESHRFSVELAIGDSTGRMLKFGKKDAPAAGSAVDSSSRLEQTTSFDIEGKLIHTIKINDELTLEGSVGLDLGRETKKDIGKALKDRWEWLRGKRQKTAAQAGDSTKRPTKAPDVAQPEWGLDLVLSYELEGRIGSLWERDLCPGSVDGTSDPCPFRIDGASVDVEIPLWSQKDDEEKKVTVAVALTAGIGSADQVLKLGVSKEFPMPKPGAAAAKPDTAALRAEEMRLRTQLTGRMAAHTGERPDCDADASRDHGICKAQREWERAYKKLEDARKPGDSGGGWRIRLSAGHMPLGDIFIPLINLVRGGS